jgi:transcriptional regulator with GAF, ATPase, and Fis domain
LIDSELFGHEKGAFTGAIQQKRGAFERAGGGTLFLDEVGELPLNAQVRFLRVLQDKQLERVGGTQTVDLDIRVIAATNRDMRAMVGSGDFREDLWFRLNVFPIWLPPLRERKSDIPALLSHFLEQKSADMKLPEVPRIAPGGLDALMEYDWPGNVREFANIIERALILTPSGPILFENLDPYEGRGRSPRAEIPFTPLPLEELVAEHIRKTLIITEGRIDGRGGAADLMGINPSTLRSRMKKLGISTASG